jgi:hypothetical protein
MLADLCGQFEQACRSGGLSPSALVQVTQAFQTTITELESAYPIPIEGVKAVERDDDAAFAANA